MTTATGVREVPQPPAEVWRALAVLEPYCAVCDVSYVVDRAGSGPQVGTTFVCAPGELAGAAPRPGSPRGEILAWDEPRLVVTRLDLTPETWTTRLELAGTSAGGTQVSITVTHEPVGGRVVRRLQRGAMRRLVRRTVDAELAKVPAHVARAANTA
ncbi:SRPBCC family protein [Blastococcus saxobsidens]|uniref:Polyketide cyclase / dehydrase and lipid transport n=1 Tax=Blastococcus saxobsidens (strain DD2) TaxID=1146883 RepID=H6RJF5_BLASD|nr:SRPBCC family protein [Blastococcus saxobsidens]CCG01068.1 Polyketide cyclase / dehydrase and lipid transport [Blastococcus saxobsidens DD2]